MFSSYRVFTIKTEPEGWTVNRSREDFKWFIKKLKEELPSANVEISLKIRLLKLIKVK